LPAFATQQHVNTSVAVSTLHRGDLLDPGTHGTALRSPAAPAPNSKFAAGELVESGFVLKEDDLTVRLTARLKSNTDLRHRRIAHVLALFVDSFAAVCGAHPETALSNGGKTA
jgi:hypothetical protein